MVKFGCGILMLAFGAVITLWVAYNLLIARQPEFNPSVLSGILTPLLPATLPTVTGGSQPHQNMQPYLVLYFIIALQGIFPSQT